MKVSVIIPAYNAEKYIKEAIESVLNQAYPVDEIIVVDDGSTDATGEIVRGYINRKQKTEDRGQKRDCFVGQEEKTSRNDNAHPAPRITHDVIYSYQVNKGAAAARNRGIQEAKGEYIAFLDADDLWKPDKIEKEIKFLEQNPEYKMVFCDMSHMVDDILVFEAYLKEKSYRYVSSGEIYKALLQECFIFTPTVLVHKECFKETGLFDETYKICEDYGLWLRIAKSFKIGFVDKPLVVRRRVMSNITKDSMLYINSEIRLLKDLLLIENKDKYISAIIKNRLKKGYFELGYCYWDRSEMAIARRNFIKAGALSYVFSSFLPKWLIKSLKMLKEIRMFSKTKRFIREVVMFISAVIGVCHIFRFLNRRKILILMYHGVTKNKYGMLMWPQMPEEKFRWQMRYIKRHYNVMRLDEVVTKIGNKEKLPERIAVVTFDDGYKNNRTNAFTIIKEMNIPVSIFLTVGMTGSKDTIWTNRLYKAFEAGKGNELDLREYGMGFYRPLTLTLSPEGRGKWVNAYQKIKSLLKKMPPDKKDKMLEVICNKLGVEEMDFTKDEDFGFLSWEEVLEMFKSRLVDFGAHTLTHEIITNLPKDIAQKEIIGSCEMVRSKLNKINITFAYPNGTRYDFNDWAKDLLRQNNCLCGLTTIEGLNNINQDLFELKRIPVGADVSKSGFKVKCAINR